MSCYGCEAKTPTVNGSKMPLGWTNDAGQPVFELRAAPDENKTHWSQSSGPIGGPENGCGGSSAANDAAVEAGDTSWLHICIHQIVITADKGVCEKSTTPGVDCDQVTSCSFVVELTWGVTIYNYSYDKTRGVGDLNDLTLTLTDPINGGTETFPVTNVSPVANPLPTLTPLFDASPFDALFPEQVPQADGFVTQTISVSPDCGGAQSVLLTIDDFEPVASAIWTGAPGWQPWIPDGQTYVDGLSLDMVCEPCGGSTGGGGGEPVNSVDQSTQGQTRTAQSTSGREGQGGGETKEPTPSCEGCTAKSPTIGLKRGDGQVTVPNTPFDKWAQGAAGGGPVTGDPSPGESGGTVQVPPVYAPGQQGTGVGGGWPTDPRAALSGLYMEWLPRGYPNDEPPRPAITLELQSIGCAWESGTCDENCAPKTDCTYTIRIIFKMTKLMLFTSDVDCALQPATEEWDTLFGAIPELAAVPGNATGQTGNTGPNTQPITPSAVGGGPIVADKQDIEQFGCSYAADIEYLFTFRVPCGGNWDGSISHEDFFMGDTTYVRTPSADLSAIASAVYELTIGYAMWCSYCNDTSG